MELLDLPHEIRKKIWRLLLTRLCPVDLKFEKRRIQARLLLNYCGPKGCFPQTYSLTDLKYYAEECHGPRFSVHVLYTCQKIYHEASEVLYGENKFAIRMGPEEKLPNINLARLRSMHLLVPYINLGDSTWEYQKVIERIKLNPEARFALSLGTIDSDYTIASFAKSIVTLAPVKSASLTFGTPTMARKVASELMAFNSISQPTFPQYSKLPKELQFHILSYTDLAQDYLVSDGWMRVKPACCNQCCDTLIVCCCNHIGFSPTCRCVYNPLPFFQVSHEFRKDAIQVAFNQSLFKFESGIPQTLLYFDKIKLYLPMMRRVVLRLEEGDIDDWEEGTCPWDDFITCCKTYLDLPLLSLTIIGGWTWSDDTAEGLDEDEEMEEFIYESGRALELYHGMLPGLKKLAQLGLRHLSLEFTKTPFGGLKDLFEKMVMGEDYVNNVPRLPVEGIWFRDTQ